MIPYSRTNIVRAIVRECGREAAIYAGRTFGMKAHSVRSIISKETQRMRRVGWQPVDAEFSQRSAAARAAWDTRRIKASSPDHWKYTRSDKQELLRMADPSQLSPGRKAARTKLLRADERSARDTRRGRGRR